MKSSTNQPRFMIPADSPRRGLAAAAAGLSPWFHNLHLPDGSETAPAHPLGDFPACMWDQIKAHLPDDLTGWQVLDVGCNAGFYSLELARRGASVTALEPDPHFLRQARWAAAEMGFDHRIQFIQAGVYDLARHTETYDLVMFTGVFYHLRHPLLALDILAEKTRRLMVFQTMTLPGGEVVEPPRDQDFADRDAMNGAGWPKMAFIEHAMAGDPTNWWIPNHAAVEAMLRSAGFRTRTRPGHEIYLCTPDHPLPADAMKRNRAELSAATGRTSDENDTET